MRIPEALMGCTRRRCLGARCAGSLHGRLCQLCARAAQKRRTSRMCERAVISAAHQPRRSEHPRPRHVAWAHAAHRSHTARSHRRRADTLAHRCTRRVQGTVALRRGYTGARGWARRGAGATWAQVGLAPPLRGRRQRRPPPFARPIFGADSVAPCCSGQAPTSRVAARPVLPCSPAPCSRPCRRASLHRGTHGCRLCS